MQQTQSATRTPAKKSFEAKPLTKVIGENLGKDVEKQIEDTIEQATNALRSTQSYVTSHRAEAITLAAIIGVGTWALLFTKPGRQVFEMAAPKVLPLISDAVSGFLNLPDAQKS